MKLTEALRKYLREQCGVAAGATDDDYRKAVTAAIMEGKLTPAKLAELTEVKSEAEERVGGMIADATKHLATKDDVAKAVAGLDWKSIIQAATGAGVTTPPVPTPPDQKDVKTPAGGDEQTVPLSAVKGMIDSAIAAVSGGDGGIAKNPQSLITRGHGGQGGLEAHSVRVKKAIDRWDGTKSVATYRDRPNMGELKGQPIQHLDRTLHTPSQADKAVIGAFAKFLVGCDIGQPFFRMSEHEKDLVEYAVKELPWVGFVGGEGDGPRDLLIDGRKLTELEQKALLNDGTSGGVNAVPVIYDDQAVMAPIQTGELFPLVNTTSLARGRIVRAFSIGEPTISSGVPEGTPIPLFDTTGFISSLDTTIYPCVGAVEIGLDFEEDSPANFGQIMIDQYGMVHLRWLDDQIALGDGTTEPLGIFNTGTLTVVQSVNGPGGPNTLSDLEALIFGVDRKYRRAAGGRMVFIMNDQTYRRFRTIATATGWNTRLFGENYENYSVLGYPVKIIPDVPNNKIAFVNLAFYRMYRRQGLQVKSTTEGRELTLKNLRLIVVRALWGGRLLQGGAGSIMVDAAA